MSGENKPYSSRRWTDIPKAEVIGTFEMTPEEEEAETKELMEFIARREEAIRKEKEKNSKK